MREPHVVILGGGPAGVGGAYQLRRTGRARVTLIEQQATVGGNAGSFEAAGQRLDYGSHRMHAACDPAILADIRSLLGDDLLDRPRHGRILLRGSWIHFPLRAADLMLRLDRKFAAGALLDMTLGKLMRVRTAPATESFETALRSGLGKTICEEFYFPYARKIWGIDASELSAVQAHRRVSAASFTKLLRRLLPAFSSRQRQAGKSHFYYPRRGYGQISEAYAEAARKLGADIRLETKLVGIARTAEPDGGTWSVTVSHDGVESTLQADHVWSTVPLPVLARLMRPPAPADVLAAAGAIRHRAMLLVYLHLNADRFTEYDAHYFPGEDIRITRLSEPKNYAALDEPLGRTTLCAELPCSVEDAIWSRTDAELAEVVTHDLEQAGIPLPGTPAGAHVRRLRHAYPVYARGYEVPFGTLDRWVESLPDFLSYGRQGLFAHDNTHHALYMAYCAADCLRDGVFDRARWAGHRRTFETHVVED